jgi:hypothetical protein
VGVQAGGGKVEAAPMVSLGLDPALGLDRLGFPGQRGRCCRVMGRLGPGAGDD